MISGAGGWVGSYVDGWLYRMIVCGGFTALIGCCVGLLIGLGVG